jgi:ABC-type uncharacterized transport system substrate-binding protein
MWSVIKRLALGMLLIVAASAVLLLSDSAHRRPSRQRVARIAILQHASQPILDEGVEGMIEGLAASGFTADKNLFVQRYNAEGDLPTANTIAKEVTAGSYDLVLTASTLSMQAVANANTAGKVIHVFALVSDPAGAGVGISREHPLQHPRHLVGYGTMQPVAETFRLAKQIFPELTVVGEVWNPAEANSEAQTKLARQACRTLGIQLLEANVENSSGVREAASSLIARGAQALWIGGDVTVLSALDSVIPLARQSAIPVFTSMPGGAGRGTLFDLGANYREVGRLAGTLAGQILNGRDPATVAVENVLPEKLLVDTDALAGLRDPWRFPDDVLHAAQVSHKSIAAVTPQMPGAGRRYKVGVVYFAPEPGVETCMRGVFDGLRDRGFVEGANLEVHKAHAQGEIANIPALYQNYDTQDLDVIIPMSTPCLTAACGTVKHTPVVFTYVYDPIAAGAGTSFEEHNPNVTGVGSFPPIEETVEFIQRLVPGAKMVGTLYNSSEANSRKVVSVAREVVARRGMHLEEATVVNSNEVFQAAQALVARSVDVLWVAGDNTAIQGFDAIVKVANDARVPLITSDIEPVANASLATLGVGFYEPGYAAGQLAARVLLGEHPKDLPFQNVSIKTVSLNLTVARRLGIRIPDDILRSAAVLVDETGVHQQATTPPTATAVTSALRPAPLGKTWKIDVLEYINVLDVEEGEKGIEAGLREAGLVVGRDYALRVRNAQGDMPTLSALVDAAVTEGTDLVMTLSTPTLQAALQRARDVPIVFTFVASAVAAGAGRSNEDHVPNVTGVPTMSAYEELIATVQECLPAAHRIGTLFVPAEVNSVYNKDQLTAVARAHGIEVAAVAANTSSEISDAALALSNQPIDAVVQVAGNLTSAAFASITQAARRARLPLFGSLSSNIHDGAAVVVARDYFDGGREAGLMAARIMRGENPARIPFQPLRTTKTLVNAEAARALGLTIPASVMHRAAVINKTN